MNKKLNANCINHKSISKCVWDEQFRSGLQPSGSSEDELPGKEPSWIKVKKRSMEVKSYGKVEGKKGRGLSARDKL